MVFLGWLDISNSPTFDSKCKNKFLINFNLLSIITFQINLINATTFSIMTLSITTFIIMSLSIKGLLVTLSIKTLWIKCHNSECGELLILCWKSLCGMLLCWMLLCSVSLCWMSWRHLMPQINQWFIMKALLEKINISLNLCLNHRDLSPNYTDISVFTLMVNVS